MAHSLPTGSHLASIANSSLTRMRRSANDIYAMARDTELRIDEAFLTYCMRVSTSVNVCQTIVKDFLPMFSMPPLTVFNTDEGITEMTFTSAWLAASRLNQALARLAADIIESLLRRRHGGMAACVAITDGRDPCPIICDKGKKPERQLYCDLHQHVLPRMRNLVQLLQTKITDPTDTYSSTNDRDHDAIRSHRELRWYALTVLEYSQEQMSLIAERFDDDD
ncbi:hypothetical protein LSAT2_017409 [Lamellibrachia satsuma]|nr:hypothetical protein LSAT2_017409 [Lamellibrachia satsuma]